MSDQLGARAGTLNVDRRRPRCTLLRFRQNEPRTVVAIPCRRLPPALEELKSWGQVQGQARAHGTPVGRPCPAADFGAESWPAAAPSALAPSLARPLAPSLARRVARSAKPWC